MGGRKVRCAHCRFSWFQEGPEAPPLPPPPRAAPERPHPPTPERTARPIQRAAPRETAPPPPQEPEPEPEPNYAYAEAAPEPIDWSPAEADPEPRRRPRRNPARMWTLLAAVAAMLMVGALAALYFIGPQQIAAWTGADVDTGERFRFTRREVSREPLPTDKELLTVTGEIQNVSNEEQRVPQIRAEVTDAEQRVIYSWTIAPPVTHLQPGQSTTFVGTSTDVPKGGKNLNLKFGPVT